MNTRLVDSLVNLIESLSSEEYNLLQATLNQRAIQKDSKICSGDARIRKTRIPVWTLVSFRQQGASDREILNNYPGLIPNDLTAAWLYYQQNQEEIDRLLEIEDNV